MSRKKRRQRADSLEKFFYGKTVRAKEKEDRKIREARISGILRFLSR